MHLLNLIRKREVDPYPPCTASLRIRNFYSCIYPNYTLYNVNIPFHIKRFSLDCRFLICFSKTLKELLVYRYQGPNSTRTDLGFDDFFKFHYSKSIPFEPQLLCKDFCLFTKTNKVNSIYPVDYCFQLF